METYFSFHPSRRLAADTFSWPAFHYTARTRRLLLAFETIGCTAAPFDWMRWERVEQPDAGDWIERADRSDLGRYKLTLDRRERFGDGNIAGALADGIYRRMAARWLELEEGASGDGPSED